MAPAESSLPHRPELAIGHDEPCVRRYDAIRAQLHGHAVVEHQADSGGEPASEDRHPQCIVNPQTTASVRQRHNASDHAEPGVEYLKAVFKNVPVQDKSARDSLQTFSSGKGDVLIAYENEAITAQRKGVALDYIIPPQTILIENPVAVTKDGSSKDAAKAFVKYLYTPEAQGIFASKGYRPVVKSAAGADKFPTPKQLFTIQKFGGWSTVSTKFFDPDKGIMAGIEKGLGVSTAK